MKHIPVYITRQSRRKNSNTNFELKGKVCAFDSTTIDLCLNVFWWAKYHKTKGGTKLHTLYDNTTQIPAFIHVTDAALHDVNAIDVIPHELPLRKALIP